MTEPQKAERDEFEKYWSARGWLFNDQIVYEDDDTKNAWAIWQAAFEAGRRNALEEMGSKIPRSSEVPPRTPSSAIGKENL